MVTFWAIPLLHSVSLLWLAFLWVSMVWATIFSATRDEAVVWRVREGVSNDYQSYSTSYKLQADSGKIKDYLKPVSVSSIAVLSQLWQMLTAWVNICYILTVWVRMCVWGNRVSVSTLSTEAQQKVKVSAQGQECKSDFLPMEAAAELHTEIVEFSTSKKHHSDLLFMVPLKSCLNFFFSNHQH